MPNALDDLMETASQALADMDYARCESLCIDALAEARKSSDWVIYRRVLLPLQEARRQKRQDALDRAVMLGTPQRAASLDELLGGVAAGCVVLTWPYTTKDAAELSRAVTDAGLSIELLFADNKPGDAVWHITSWINPSLRVELPAPKAEWVGTWIDPHTITPPTPAHWFMQANEALGNAALASIESTAGSLAYLDALEQALRAVGDHEILHQRLADAAKALHGEPK